MIGYRAERLPVRLCLAAVLMLPALCASAADAPEQPTLPDNATGVLDRSTPDRLLQFYIEAHERKDIEMYQQALHQQYVFVAEPRSAERMGMPRWISRARDILAQDRMFGDPWIESIQIQLLPLTKWYPCKAVIAPDSNRVETIEALEIAVDPTMCVRAVDPGGEARVYTFDRNTLYITVVSDPLQAGSWVILRIEEQLETD